MVVLLNRWASVCDHSASRGRICCASPSPDSAAMQCINKSVAYGELCHRRPVTNESDVSNRQSMQERAVSCVVEGGRGCCGVCVMRPPQFSPGALARQTAQFDIAKTRCCDRNFDSSSTPIHPS
jgi:hypothetical protein